MVNGRNSFNTPRMSGKNTSQFKGHNSRSFEQNLPEGYLKDGYFDIVKGDRDSKKLKRELILNVAQKISIDIGNARPELKGSQLRKYYDYSVNINEKLKKLNGSFDMVESDVAKLKIFVADGLTKKKIPKIFYDFISKNVEMIKNADDFNKGFIEHFQAVVAYYKKNN